MLKMFMGLDMEAFKTYSSWIDHVKHRSDLTYVLDILEEKLPLATPSLEGGLS
jgi:hypothetical protein